MNVAGMLHANTKRARESSRLGQDSSKLNVYPMRRCVTPDVETLKNRVLAEQEKNALLQEANEELRRRCAHLFIPKRYHQGILMLLGQKLSMLCILAVTMIF